MATDFVLLVPTLCVGTQCADALRRLTHRRSGCPVRSQCVPTQSVGTRSHSIPIPKSL